MEIVTVEGDGPVRHHVINIRGDMGEKVTMGLCVEQDGDVILTLAEPGRGVMEIQFCTLPGSGHNPEITKRLCELAEFLAKGGSSDAEG